MTRENEILLFTTLPQTRARVRDCCAPCANVRGGSRDAAQCVSRATAQGVALHAAFADKSPQHLRSRFPTLENFAVVSSADLVGVAQSMLSIMQQMAENAAKGVTEDEEMG